ncbi:MBL fold metallo-hydrolase (plasmid) [Haloarcula salina]|uniref:MBL fold metallo-hydrolase n=1 Tax=Haloarcula salina TaxID=1429914 RepID=UPI003C6EAE23
MVEITVLSDNTVVEPLPRGLRGEWGFAAVVDDVLLDTGQSAALHNASLLDVPVDQLDDIVVSHTHYDHTTGLLDFLEEMDHPNVYLHPEVWTHRELAREGAFEGEPLGIPYDRSTIAAKADIVEHREPVEVADGIYALGEIPREHPDAVIGRVHDEDGIREDQIPDDQSIVVETGDGLALVLGCCHAGLRNTVEHAEAVCDGTVRYIIGGTHLVASTPEEIHDVADWLDGTVDLIAGAHCTGSEAAGILNERLPDVFTSIGVGSRISLESATVTSPLAGAGSAGR